MNTRISGWDLLDMQKHFTKVVSAKCFSGTGKVFAKWPFWQVNTTATLSKLLLSQSEKKGSYTLCSFGRLYWVCVARSLWQGGYRASVRSCQKLPPCPTEPMPSGIKMDPPLTKAKAISNGGSASGITRPRRKKPCVKGHFQLERGMRTL